MRWNDEFPPTFLDDCVTHAADEAYYEVVQEDLVATLDELTEDQSIALRGLDTVFA